MLTRISNSLMMLRGRYYYVQLLSRVSGRIFRTSILAESHVNPTVIRSIDNFLLSSAIPCYSGRCGISCVSNSPNLHIRNNNNNMLFKYFPRNEAVERGVIIVAQSHELGSFVFAFRVYT